MKKRKRMNKRKTNRRWKGENKRKRRTCRHSSKAFLKRRKKKSQCKNYYNMKLMISNYR